MQLVPPHPEDSATSFSLADIQTDHCRWRAQSWSWAPPEATVTGENRPFQQYPSIPGGGYQLPLFCPGGVSRLDSYSTSHTFSVSSFLTDLRLALRSMDTLCFEPSRALSMASAETRTRRKGGRLNFPRRSSTFNFRSLIYRTGEDNS